MTEPDTKEQTKTNQPILTIENKEELVLLNAVLTSLIKDCVNDPEGTWLKWVNSKDDIQIGNAAFAMTRPLVMGYNAAKKLLKEQGK